MTTTMFERLFSSYVSRTYRGDRDAFERIQNYFSEVARLTEDAWVQVRDEETEAVFKKGTEVAFTFDYRSPTLEVRSIITHDTSAETITVTVGNKGFPGEVHMAKPRYQALLDKIDEYVTSNGIATEVTA